MGTSSSCSPVDPYTGNDELFFATSDYVTPGTQCLADASKVVDAEAKTGNDAIADPDSFITRKLKSLPPPV